MNIKELKFDSNGLIPAIMQDGINGEVLMLAYMNAESLKMTLDTGFMHFRSRSKNELWKKDESSGNTQKVREITYDCDSDTLLIKISQKGVACHAGSGSCFTKTLYQDLPDKNSASSDENPNRGEIRGEIIGRIYDVILDRKNNSRGDSYVSSLMKKGKDKILKKIGEEASEVIIGSKNDNTEEIVWEVADLWFHSLVLLGFHDITPEEIYCELEQRFGVKGKK